MSNKSPEQLVEDDKATKAELKIARAKKIKGVQDVCNLIYTFIYEMYKKHCIPVDKFGHFYSKGGETVEDRVNPDFSDIDLIVAKLFSVDDKLDNLYTLMLSIDAKLDKLLGKRGGKQSQ